MKRPVRVSENEKLVLTANGLIDGRIVWRDAQGKWQHHFRKAALYDVDAAQSELEKAQKTAQADGVVSIYEVAVKDETPIEPVSVRERIRAYGPSVHPEFAVENEL
ncbi:DUF2849 domain-containing protein [Swingsia samuiensis]|uniref:DUF2849 domain-containing protein n=1 Tax=Swingsia samuiensis TaxID=1293412 RepID=A0A4Y6UK02_9PROT|nr:DUF2849 domain-containing protein [Swingsia samuiensis]QDH16806.1 DUF2849 domain-containing protein [Swingsia samuiensis]